LGAVGGCGIVLSDHFASRAVRGGSLQELTSLPPISSVILLFYYGGPSHLDTWDMKPNAPPQVRGNFRPIATKVPGIFLSEHLPWLARVMDKLALVRSVHHPMTNHNAAAVEALAGRTPLKGDLELLAEDGNDFPCFGAALSHLLPRRGEMPTFVALPHVMYNVVKLPGQNAGFLGSAHEPFQVTQDPNAADFHLAELDLPSGMTASRLAKCRHLLHDVDRPAARRGGAARLDVVRERAFGLLDSHAIRRAFDVGREHPKVRDRYGRNIHGQSVLLARRLVEAGVPAIHVYDKVTNGQDNWDTHENNFGKLKDRLLPPMDQAVSALVEDLQARGRLDSTLVVALGEFGRTPRLNGTAGRDHWPYCFSVVLAGGGVRGGVAYGSSDKLGAYPHSDPVTPGDLAATIYWRFGLDPATEVRDLTGRPYRVAEGEPIKALF
jgi:hypothetical protein